MDTAELHLVLSDRNRRRILELVLSGERTVSDLVRATRLRQPLVSHHLRVLRDAGLVSPRREGRFRLYRAASPPVARALAALEQQAAAVLEAAGDEEAGGARPANRPAPAAALKQQRKRG